MRAMAEAEERSATSQAGISLVSASMAVHVQTSPQPNSPRCSSGTFRALALQKLQISSAWRRRQERSRSTRSWYSEQAAPRSTRSLVTVFLATPVRRTVARIELPSTRHLTTAVLWPVESLFILTIMLDRSGIVKVQTDRFC